jgi:hypothetical protein
MLPVGENDRVTHDVAGREIILQAENFEAKGMDDEDAYFEEMHDAYQRRMQATPGQENYDDVYWWPYEWLLKVGTEYYFRYEGTQTVPPCYDTAHWRILKDPIQVAPHQMRELERLTAWRIGNNCEADTAGKPRPGNDDAMDVALVVAVASRAIVVVILVFTSTSIQFSEYVSHLCLLRSTSTSTTGSPTSSSTRGSTSSSNK